MTGAVAVVADRRLCTTADRSEMVEENDPRAAWLLAAAGHTIQAGDVVRYGVTVVDGVVYYRGGAPVPEPSPKAKAGGKGKGSKAADAGGGDPAGGPTE